MLANYPGVADIRKGFGREMPQISFEIKPAGQALGITARELDSQEIIDRYIREILPRDPSLERMSEPVVSPQVTEWLRWLMWLTVAKGTSTKAAAEGYLVGGKTGTADKVAENGRGYQRGAVISSFLGAFPIHDPQYLVMVSLDEPQGNDDTQGYRYAGWTAAPSVAEIIRAIGPLLGVQPVSAEVRERMEAQLRIMPTINGRTKREEDGFEFVGPTR